jgi:hypothetical protein
MANPLADRLQPVLPWAEMSTTRRIQLGADRGAQRPLPSISQPVVRSGVSSPFVSSRWTSAHRHGGFEHDHFSARLNRTNPLRLRLYSLRSGICTNRPSRSFPTGLVICRRCHPHVSRLCRCRVALLLRCRSNLAKLFYLPAPTFHGKYLQSTITLCTKRFFILAPRICA